MDGFEDTDGDRTEVGVPGVTWISRALGRMAPVPEGTAAPPPPPDARTCSDHIISTSTVIQAQLLLPLPSASAVDRTLTLTSVRSSVVSFQAVLTPTRRSTTTTTDRVTGVRISPVARSCPLGLDASYTNTTIIIIIVDHPAKLTDLCRSTSIDVLVEENRSTTTTYFRQQHPSRRRRAGADHLDGKPSPGRPTWMESLTPVADA